MEVGDFFRSFLRELRDGHMVVKYRKKLLPFWMLVFNVKIDVKYGFSCYSLYIFIPT